MTLDALGGLAVSALLLVVPIAVLVLLAARYRTMSLAMTVGLFSVGGSAMMLGFAILEGEPCTQLQLLLRGGTLGIGMLLIMWSMLRKRAAYARHDSLTASPPSP